MSYNPSTLVPLAESLLDEPASIEAEARFRSAVNRSYYGPLIRLKQRIERAQAAPAVPKEGTHSWIRRALGATRSPQLLKLKSELQTLSVRREEADYEPDRISVLREDAEDAIEEALRVLRSIELISDCLLESLKG